MKRNKFSLSNYKLLTGKLGQLIPCNLVEVLPGDSFLAHSSALVRCTPLLAPLMHPVQVRLHHWFCPTRLVWDGWEDFITGGNDGIGGSAGAYPTLSGGGSGFTAKGVLDYLGVKPGIANLEVSAIPNRIYNRIFNDAYRDQDMIATEISEDSDVIQRIAWEKDYFTASRPWPQRGPDVTLPLGTKAPIKFDTGFAGSGVADDKFYVADGSSGTAYGDTANVRTAVHPTADDANLYADMSAVTATSVNAFREAMAKQRYAEARAMYGARLTEYLRYLGIRPQDARLQRPEYLGGGKHNISFSEVLQTSDDGTNGEVGALKGHGIAAMRTNKYMKFFPEHGYVMTLMSVRPKSMYTDGVNRTFNKRTKEDYWQKELEFIGQQEITKKEVYAQGTSADDEVFSYGDRYAEYRNTPSNIAGEFRDNTYNFWHMGRQFASMPTLNQSFTDCDPGARFFAEQTFDHLLVMVNNSVRARRLVSKKPSPRIY
jgi:hypothetical protein